MAALLSLVAAFISPLVFFFLWRKLSAKSGAVTPPQPPGAWPIVGHLPLIGGQRHIARTMAELAGKYGDVFGLRMGMTRVVMVSSRDAATEFFTSADKSFVNRPQSSTGKHLAYDSAAFGFANGPYWREMRKMVTTEVLSARRLDAMRNLRVSEISQSIRELHGETGGEPRKLDLSRWVEQLTLNIIVKTIAGKRYGRDSDEVKSFRKQISEFTFLAGEFVISDVIPIPFLKWLDPQNYLKRMKKVSRELDLIIERWIEEHLLRRNRGEVKTEQDFIDAMLAAIEDNKLNATNDTKSAPSKMTIMKATVVNVILGGFDTTSVFILWLLSLLMNHSDCLEKAQREIDDKIGRERWVQESDIADLPYLQAIVKETLRLYPPLPLSIPREAAEDCRVGGYLIPKGTQVFVNLWKLHRDPAFWESPDNFSPERFLESKAQIEVMGKNFEFAPFGAGRRSCPGSSFAIQVTSLLIGRLIQGFDLSAGGGVDMEEGLGITMPRAHPLEVAVSPRLAPILYEN